MGLIFVLAVIVPVVILYRSYRLGKLDNLTRIPI